MEEKFNEHRWTLFASHRSLLASSNSPWPLSPRSYLLFSCYYFTYFTVSLCHSFFRASFAVVISLSSCGISETLIRVSIFSLGSLNFLCPPFSICFMSACQWDLEAFFRNQCFCCYCRLSLSLSFDFLSSPFFCLSFSFSLSPFPLNFHQHERKASAFARLDFSKANLSSLG